jgi:glutamine amidotransferase
MIHIVDYEMGNLRSVQKAFEHLGHEAVTTSDPDVVRKADHVVVPGVGAFPDAMLQLRNKGLDQAIVEFARGGKPLLGICLGMQLFMDESEEYGRHEGLGLFGGKVLLFKGLKDAQGLPLKIPHMGWNTLRSTGVLAPILDGKYVYFVHSYYVAPKLQAEVAATTEYGIEFCSALARDNIWAAQFHPEKSGPAGMALLDQFSRRTM